MFRIRGFLQFVFNSCLSIDRGLISTIDKIARRIGFGKSSRAGLFTVRSELVIKRAVIYLSFFLFMAAIGFYCKKSNDDNFVGTLKKPPGKVDSIKVTYGDSQVTVQWTEAKDASEYFLWMGKGDVAPKEIKVFASSEALFSGDANEGARQATVVIDKSLADAVIENYQKYCFQIQAKNDQGRGLLSDRKCAIPRTDSFDRGLLAGSELTMNVGEADQRLRAELSFSWNNIKGMTHYKIYRFNNKGEAEEIGEISSSSSCSGASCTYVVKERINIESEAEVLHSYGVRPLLRFTDIDENGEKTSLVTVAGPEDDFIRGSHRVKKPDAFSFICSNGQRDTTAKASSEGRERCISCDTGFIKTGQNSCVKESEIHAYVCSHGTPVADIRSSEPNVQRCASCSQGAPDPSNPSSGDTVNYILSGQKTCVLQTHPYKCSNGVVDSDGESALLNAQKCISCNSGYQLVLNAQDNNECSGITPTISLGNSNTNGVDGAVLTLNINISEASAAGSYILVEKNSDGSQIGSDISVNKGSIGETDTSITRNIPYGVTRTYAVTPLIGGVPYLGRVSNSLTVPPSGQTLKPTLPADITGLGVATNITTVTRLEWDDVARSTHYTVTRAPAGNNLDIITLADKESKTTSFLCTTKCSYVDTSDLEAGTYTYSVQPVIRYKSGEPSADADISGNAATVSPSLIKGILTDPTDFVDPFIGTLNSVGDSYQASKVFPLVSEPFGMVVFTVANGFRKGQGYEDINDEQVSRDSGRQKPGYTSGDLVSSKIKGFSAYSYQGPGCDLGHDFLMMPAVGTSGNGDWLSNRAAMDGTVDFQIKKPHRLKISKADREAENADTEREWGEPGYYRVTTNSNVLIEITATKRTGMMRITYPQATATASTGYFHLASYSRTPKLDDDNSSVRASLSNKGLEGKVRTGKFCGEGGQFRYEMFLSGEFDRAYSSPILRAADSNEIKVSFATTSSRTVVFKFGLSFVSHANARKNMIGDSTNSIMGESPNFNFDTIKTSNRNTWKTVLSKVQVRDTHEGGNSEYGVRTSHKRRLYTTLFRSMIHPNVFSDIDRKYIGFNGSAEVAGTGGRTGVFQNLPGSQGAQYQYFSNWDIYRTQTPLVAFLYKDTARDISRSLINNANQSGSADNTGGFTRWGVANHDSGVMGGDPGAIIVSSSEAFGATLSSAEVNDVVAIFNRSGKLSDLDLRRANGPNTCNTSTSICNLVDDSSQYATGAVLTNLRSDNTLPEIKSTLIWNNPFSRIMELASADYAKAAFLSRTGGTDTQNFRVSSGGWTQLFRRGHTQFKLAATKMNDIIKSSQCSWHDDHTCFHEGTYQHYRFSVPHNIAGLFEEINKNNVVNGTTSIVSNASVKSLLDQTFFQTNGNFIADMIGGESSTTYNAGNQVGMGTPFMYHYIGLPNTSTKILREKLADYWPDALKAYPGNEDGGSMSAQFVWSALGLYPHTPGTDRLFLLYPWFDYIELDLSDGDTAKKLTLKRDPASTVPITNKKACIEAVTINGFNDNGTIRNNYAHTKSYIKYRNIGTNTILSFKIVPRVSGACTTTWGRKAADIPPSATDD